MILFFFIFQILGFIGVVCKPDLVKRFLCVFVPGPSLSKENKVKKDEELEELEMEMMQAVEEGMVEEVVVEEVGMEVVLIIRLEVV